MPDMRSAFGSGEYLRASDLKGKTPVQIGNLGQEQVRSENGVEDKWVISFVGKKKRLILNVTNNNTLIDAFGYESDDWVGQRIILKVERVQFGTKVVDAIRIEPAPPAQAPAPDPVPVAPAVQQHQPVDDSDIPF